jgi:hypothetical protein
METLNTYNTFIVANETIEPHVFKEIEDLCLAQGTSIAVFRFDGEFFSDRWEARHNEELWHTSPTGILGGTDGLIASDTKPTGSSSDKFDRAENIDAPVGGGSKPGSPPSTK